MEIQGRGCFSTKAKNDDAHACFNQPSGQQQLIVTERRVVILAIVRVAFAKGQSE